MALAIGIKEVLILSAVAAGFAAAYGLGRSRYGNANYQFGPGRFSRQSPPANDVFLNRRPALQVAYSSFRRKNLPTGLVFAGLSALARDESVARGGSG